VMSGGDDFSQSLPRSSSSGAEDITQDAKVRRLPVSKSLRWA
jgi:hypothetical protein